MALGRPIITTNVAGCRETVEDGVNGFLVPPRNVNALVDAMTRLIENPQLITIMGKQSRRWLRNVSTFVNKLKNLSLSWWTYEIHCYPRKVLKRLVDILGALVGLIILSQSC